MIRNNIVLYAATLGGAFLAVAGLAGFLIPNLLGLHFSAVTNLLHLTSGALALYFGLKSTSLLAARTFCQVIGVLFTLAGLVGLVHAFAMGSAESAQQIVPHAAYLALGAGFVAAALVQPLRPASTSLL